MERSTPPTKVCLHCQTEFTPNSGKQIYCQSSCKVAAFKSRQQQESEQLHILLDDKTNELEALKNEPKSRKEVVQEVNPDWQLLKQKVDAQDRECQNINTELTALHSKAAELLSTKTFATTGICFGVILACIPIAIGYDARSRRPLGMTFVVLSVTSLFSLVLFGHYVGNAIGKSRLADDKQRVEQIESIKQRQDELNKRLMVEQQKLKVLRQALVDVPQFSKETIIHVDGLINPLVQPDL